MGEIKSKHKHKVGDNPEKRPKVETQLKPSTADHNAKTEDPDTPTQPENEKGVVACQIKTKITK